MKWRCEGGRISFSSEQRRQARAADASSTHESVHVSHSDVHQALLDLVRVIFIVGPHRAIADSLESALTSAEIVMRAFESLAVSDIVQPLRVRRRLVSVGAEDSAARSLKLTLPQSLMARLHSPAMLRPKLAVVMFILAPK